MDVQVRCAIEKDNNKVDLEEKLKELVELEGLLKLLKEQIAQINFLEMQRSLLIIAALLSILILSEGITLKRKHIGKKKIKLKVGVPATIPEITDQEGKNKTKEEPTTDVVPQTAEHGEADDNQTHPAKTSSDDEMLETGTPPKYPLRALSAEMSAHSEEIGGCRDHPKNEQNCGKCKDRCYPQEHETYTYSFCRKSCGHCDPSANAFHTFWRLRAASEFEPDWMLNKVEFYPNTDENVTLVDDPNRAYASSVYSGYSPSFAFDNNNSTSYLPSGWGKHDNNDDWIAYEFPIAVRVHAIRMMLDPEHRTASPKKIYVEAADKKFGPFQKKWTIHNPTYEVDRVYKFLECPVLWRRFEHDEGAWCFRLRTGYVTWDKAREECEIEGGHLASILTKEEQEFLIDDIRVCGDTWIGLSHRDQAYYWDDGSNSTYRNWKPKLQYSEVQKKNLNCVAMDKDGYWKNFHCENNFNYVCRKKLVPRPPPREDLIVMSSTFDPEIPPFIFIPPNMTQPVVNQKRLEPGVFPNANGEVEEEEEEEKSQDDLFYDQAVQHLKEKGLKPSEEIENDEDEEETDYTKALNKIALETKDSDEKNETASDKEHTNTLKSQKQQQRFEKNQGEDASQQPGLNNPPPKPNEPGKPVPPPPSTAPNGADDSMDDTLPRIVDGKPLNESSKAGTPPPVGGHNSHPTNGDVPSNAPEGVRNNDGGNVQQPTQGSNQQTNNNPPPQGQNQNSPITQNSQNNNNNANNQQTSTVNTSGGSLVITGGTANNNNGSNNQNPQGNSNQNTQGNNNQNTQGNNNGQHMGAGSIGETGEASNVTQSNNNNNNNNNINNNNNNNNNNNKNNNNINNNNNNNNINNNNNKGSDGTAPKPQTTNGNAQSNGKGNGGWGNENGLPPVMGGSSPPDVPEPPPTKEGDGNDDDSKPSVGEQSDENPDQSNNNNNNENSNENDNKESENSDDNNDKDEEQSNVPEKPIPIKGSPERSEDIDDKDATNGGQNSKTGKFGKPLTKPAKTKSKIHMKVKNPIKVKSKHLKKSKKLLPKRTEVMKDENEEGSGSGDQGEDEELDDVLQSITDDLW